MNSTLEKQVYPGYTQAELDLAYSQRDWAENADQILAQWKSAVDTVKSTSPGYCEVRYGPKPDDLIDYYPAAGPCRYVHFHIHGGAWRSQTKDDCAFLAPAMSRANVDFVVPEFGKLPQCRLPQILNQLARALLWTYESLVLTGRAEKILVSGHSSGAHMAALLSMRDWCRARMDPDAILGVVCISGAYDLEPVLLSSRREYVCLDEDEALRMSPIRHVERACVALHVLYGANESPEFIRQAQAFARALQSQGKLAACLEFQQKNHFEILDAMADPLDPVGRYMLDLFRQPDIERESPGAAVE
jgi:arylformamidase